MTIDEGYIKFHCDLTPGTGPARSDVAELIEWRNHLYRVGLIGAYPDGIGFGNISMRCGDGDRFHISGTQTGNIAELDERHFTLVTRFDFPSNSLACTGELKASSESLTHASVYVNDRSIGAVIHVHHLPAWSALLGRLPTTLESVPYGTPEMAGEVSRLFRESDVSERRIFVMGGHREGIIAFGADLDEAGAVLVGELREYLQPVKS